MEEEQLRNRILTYLYKRYLEDESDWISSDRLQKEVGIVNSISLKRNIAVLRRKGLIRIMPFFGGKYAIILTDFGQSVVDSHGKDTKDKTFGSDSSMVFQYDVAISYASEDEKYVIAIEDEIRKNGINRYFRYKNEQSKLWGKDLSSFLSETFGKKSKYVLILLSESYVRKKWTDVEFEYAVKEAEKRDREFILPVRLDDAIKPGLKSTVCYLDYRIEGPKKIADILAEKIGKTPIKIEPESRQFNIGIAQKPGSLPKREREPILPKKSYTIDPGKWERIQMNVSKADHIIGTLDEIDNDSFNYCILDERNMILYKTGKGYQCQLEAFEDGAYYLDWTVPHNGPWYLILNIFGKQNQRIVVQNLRFDK
jgi:hypothetical protein